jgi:hypothetical protein
MSTGAVLAPSGPSPHWRPWGVIVLDNADWYPGTCAMLRATNLIQFDFSGFGPVNPYTWTTSLFLHRDFRARPVGERQPVPAVGSLTFTGDDDWVGGSSHEMAEKTGSRFVNPS